GGGTIAVTSSGDESINSLNARALNLNGVAIGTGVTGGFTLDSVDSTGGSDNIVLQNVTGGALSLGTGALSGASFRAFRVGDLGITADAGGTAAITYNGTITSTGTARAVAIQDRAAGAGATTPAGKATHSSGDATATLLAQN